jgi:hypothetical protein
VELSAENGEESVKRADGFSTSLKAIKKLFCKLNASCGQGKNMDIRFYGISYLCKSEAEETPFE